MPASIVRRRPEVAGFFDPRTSSIQYVVADPATRACAIIDPVLDFDEKSGTTATRSADLLLAYIQAHGLSVRWILDTHPHADHLSAAGYLKDVTGAPTAIGEHVVKVPRLWPDALQSSCAAHRRFNGTSCSLTASACASAR